MRESDLKIAAQSMRWVSQHKTFYCSKCGKRTAARHGSERHMKRLCVTHGNPSVVLATAKDDPNALYNLVKSGVIKP